MLFAHKEVTLGYSEESAILGLNTQLNDALIESYCAAKGPLTTCWKAIDIAGVWQSGE